MKNDERLRDRVRQLLDEACAREIDRNTAVRAIKATLAREGYDQTAVHAAIEAVVESSEAAQARSQAEYDERMAAFHRIIEARLQLGQRIEDVWTAEELRALHQRIVVEGQQPE